MSDSLPLTFDGLVSSITSKIALKMPPIISTDEWTTVDTSAGTCDYPTKNIGSDGFPNNKGRCTNGYKTGGLCYRYCGDKLNNSEWTEVAQNSRPGICINRTKKMADSYSMTSMNFKIVTNILFNGLVDTYFDDVNYLFYATCSITISLYDIYIGFEFNMRTNANLFSSPGGWRCDPLDPPPHSNPTYLKKEQLTNQNFTLYMPIMIDLSTIMPPNIIPPCMFGPTPSPGSIPQYITRPPCPTRVVVNRGINTYLPSCNVGGQFPSFPACPVPTAAPRPPLIYSEIISCTENPIYLKFKSKQLNRNISFFDDVYTGLVTFANAFSASSFGQDSNVSNDKIREATDSFLKSISNKIYEEILSSLTSMEYAVTVACPN